ncbi:RICIN domain-containing protein [Streptomyces sp. NPDC056656]|uniref:RICIN domain-containing protein n=1 Tax=Streptomyces sp. NPDC056656 TaxID=3345895 RepID=UPI0036C65159
MRRNSTPGGNAAAQPASAEAPEAAAPETRTGESRAAGAASGSTAASTTSSAETRASTGGSQAAAQRRSTPEGIAAARTASSGAGSGPDDDSPDTTSGPNKPVLAGAAIAGVVLIALPLLLIGANKHEEKKDRVESVAAGSQADTVLDGDDPKGRGDFVVKSPSPAAPSPKVSKSKPPKPTATKEKKAAGKSGEEKKEKPTAQNAAAAAVPVVRRPDLTDILLRNVSNGTCVSVPGSMADPMRQADCSAKDMAQRWTFEKSSVSGPSGHNTYIIRNLKNKLCVDVPNYQGVSVGTDVGEYHCDKTTKDNQLFWLEKRPDSPSTYLIHNFKSGRLCLDVSGYEDPQPGLGLTLFTCSDNDDHKWRFTHI